MKDRLIDLFVRLVIASVAIAAFASVAQLIKLWTRFQ